VGVKPRETQLWWQYLSFLMEFPIPNPSPKALKLRWYCHSVDNNILARILAEIVR